MIDISYQDFGTLCICALRYCQGRRFIPGMVRGIVKSHFKDLPIGDLKTIADDGKRQADRDLWGDDYNKAEWERFYKALAEHLEDDPCQALAEGKTSILRLAAEAKKDKSNPPL